MVGSGSGAGGGGGVRFRAGSGVGEWLHPAKVGSGSRACRQWRVCVVIMCPWAWFRGRQWRGRVAPPSQAVEGVCGYNVPLGMVPGQAVEGVCGYNVPLGMVPGQAVKWENGQRRKWFQGRQWRGKCVLFILSKSMPSLFSRARLQGVAGSGSNAVFHSARAGNSSNAGCSLVPPMHVCTSREFSV